MVIITFRQEARLILHSSKHQAITTSVRTVNYVDTVYYWNISPRNTVNNNVTNIERMEAVIDQEYITTPILWQHRTPTQLLDKEKYQT